MNLRVGGNPSIYPLGNCSLIANANGDNYLCAYREFHYYLVNGQYMNLPGIPRPGIGMCLIDRDFHPIVDPESRMVLQIGNAGGSTDDTWEDPRLFKWNE